MRSNLAQLFRAWLSTLPPEPTDAVATLRAIVTDDAARLSHKDPVGLCLAFEKDTADSVYSRKNALLAKWDAHVAKKQLDFDVDTTRIILKGGRNES